MAPQTPYGHVVATAEIFLGLLSTAVLTGLIFVRFARPRANMEFSRQITIAPHDGVPTLSLRLGNRRTGTIFQGKACLTLVRRYHTLEGHMTWRSHGLPLIYGQVLALSLAWTLRHVIDAASPLHGLSLEHLTEIDAQIPSLDQRHRCHVGRAGSCSLRVRTGRPAVGISICGYDDGRRGRAYAHRTRAAARSVAGAGRSSARLRPPATSCNLELIFNGPTLKIRVS